MSYVSEAVFLFTHIVSMTIEYFLERQYCTEWSEEQVLGLTDLGLNFDSAATTCVVLSKLFIHSVSQFFSPLKWS